MTIAQAQSLYDAAMDNAARAASEGRFDRAAAFLNLASMHYQELTRMRAAIEAMKGKNQ